MKDLQDCIKRFENEKLELLDKVQDFEKKRLTLLEKGQYSNNVRAEYEDLLCIGCVSGNKIEKVIHVVLTKIARLEVDKLPKTTFIKYMAVEAIGLAQCHIVSELSGNCQHVTLHSDGISKFGRSCTAFDLKKR